jgi:diguanylate cyclase (GGDEF)-like protein
MNGIYHQGEQFVLNDRWLFDVEQDRLLDLTGQCTGTVLKPVAARLLAIMMRTPRTVLRRRQLFDEGWRRFGFEVCDNSLNQVVCTLRNTFESLHPGHPYIKTIPRIGYCLLAEVRMVTAADRVAQLPLIDVPGATGPQRVITDTDPLTGLASRHAFDELAEDEWQRTQRSDTPLSLLMIGVDRFRNFNDRYGLAAGNEALATVAQCIGQTIHRAGDHASRYGDEEFAVLLGGTDAAGAGRVAERIRLSVPAPDCGPMASSHPVLTASIGLVSTANRRFEALQAFTGAGEAALHEAQEAGGNAISTGPSGINLRCSYG